MREATGTMHPFFVRREDRRSAAEKSVSRIFVAQPRRPQARAGVVRKLAIGRFREFGRSGRRRPSRVAGPIAATLDADFWTGTGWCQRGSERHQG